METRGKKRANTDVQPALPQKRARKEKPTSRPKLKTTSRAAPIRKYRHIPEGFGGTYTIDPEAPHIGTDGCYTCLGVYFAIDQERCFVAHINIQPQPSDGVGVPEADRSAGDYVVQTAAERSIIWWVKRNLNDEAWSADWGSITQLMRDSLVIVCPHANEESRRLIGDAALAGVKEFLGIDDEEVQPERAPGFVVAHTGSARMEVTLFPTDKELWDAVEETGAAGSDGDGEEGGQANDGAGGSEDEQDPTWAWSMVRHDGRVEISREDGGIEGPYHMDDE